MHGNARLRGPLHQLKSRIRQERRAGITDERHVLAGLEARDQLRHTLRLVVPVQRYERFVYAEGL